MQKYKKYIIPIIILTVAYIGGKFLGYKVYDSLPKKEKGSDIVVQERDDQGRPTVQIHTKEDIGIMGGGVEYLYYGNVKDDMPVTIIYSSEPEPGNFTITGSVNQFIDSNNKEDIPEDDSTLLSESSTSSGVNIDDDYNFDGYNDIYSIFSDGQGWDGVDSANIFLYDPALKKFVYNPELSRLQNIGVNANLKRVYENFSYHNEAGEIVEDFRLYKWVNDKLVKAKE